METNDVQRRYRQPLLRPRRPSVGSTRRVLRQWAEDVQIRDGA